MEDGSQPGASDIAILRTSRLSEREVVLALGCSIGIHVGMLLAALLLSGSPIPHRTVEPPFLTVSLIGTAGLGGGTLGAENGAGDGGLQASSGSGSSDGSKVAPGRSQEDAATRSQCPAMIAEKVEDDPPAPEDLLEQPEPDVFRAPSPVRQKPPSRAKRKMAAATLNAGHKLRSEISSETAAAAITNVCSPREQWSSQDAGGAGKLEGESSPGGEETAGIAAGAGSSGSGSGAGGGSPGGDHGPGEFTLQEVDQPPCPIHKVEPEFPLTARQLGMGGRVVVKFLVKRDGRVCKAFVLDAEPGGIFDKSALEAVCKWRFKPGLHRGAAVATWVILPIQFRLSR